MALRSRWWLLALSLGACTFPPQGSPGDRTTDCPREDDACACPLDEVCSAAAPYGLAFVGAALAEELPVLGSPDYLDRALAHALRRDPVRTFAVGGLQDVRVDLVRRGAPQVPFPHPFAVVAADGFAALALTPPTVRLRAAAAASSTLLRVETSTATHELLDRLPVEAAEVVRAEASAYGWVGSGAGPTALLAGVPGWVAIRLFGGADERLVDQGARLRTSTTAAPGAGWDVFAVTPGLGGDLAVTVEAGGQQLPATVAVVERAERAVWVDPRTGRAPQPQPPGALTLCVYLQGEGRDLSVAELRFSAQEPVRLVDVFEPEEAGLPPVALPPGCVTVQRATPGPATVTVEAGAFRASETFQFQ